MNSAIRIAAEWTNRTHACGMRQIKMRERQQRRKKCAKISIWSVGRYDVHIESAVARHLIKWINSSANWWCLARDIAFWLTFIVSQLTSANEKADAEIAISSICELAIRWILLHYNFVMGTANGSVRLFPWRAKSDCPRCSGQWLVFT